MYAQEIRFVPLETVSITLSSVYAFEENKCVVYYGDYGPAHEISFNKETTITVEPFHLYTKETKLKKKVLERSKSFSTNVVRIVLLSKSIGIKSIQGEYRTPKDDELPENKMLIYGTSLSQGTSTTIPEGTYPWQVARKLKMDIHNYSLAGMCLLEKEVINFIVSLPNEYSLIILEPSTNLLAQGYDVKEFTKRCEYLYKKMRNRWTDAVILFIDLFPSLFDFGLTGEFVLNSKPDIYRDSLKELVERFDDKDCHMVESKKLLSTHNLCIDLLHPTTLGYVEISNNLYNLIVQNKWIKEVE